MNPEEEIGWIDGLVEHYHDLKEIYLNQPTPALKQEIERTEKEIMNRTGQSDMSLFDPEIQEENILKNMPPDVPVN